MVSTSITVEMRMVPKKVWGEAKAFAKVMVAFAISGILIETCLFCVLKFAAIDVHGPVHFAIHDLARTFYPGLNWIPPYDGPKPTWQYFYGRVTKSILMNGVIYAVVGFVFQALRRTLRPFWG